MGILIIGCLLGVLFGVLLQRLFGSSPQSDDLIEENESLRAEIDTLRSQVDGHFATSAVMFQNLTEEYRKLLEHMSAGARALEVELPDPLLADFSGGPTTPQLAEQPEEPEEASDEQKDNPLDNRNSWESDTETETPADTQPREDATATDDNPPLTTQNSADQDSSTRPAGQ